MFGVSHRGGGIEATDTIEGARRLVAGRPSGRYEVDESRAEPYSSVHASRSWGRMIHHADGRVEDEPWPWE